MTPRAPTRGLALLAACMLLMAATVAAAQRELHEDGGIDVGTAADAAGAVNLLDAQPTAVAVATTGQDMPAQLPDGGSAATSVAVSPSGNGTAGDGGAVAAQGLAAGVLTCADNGLDLPLYFWPNVTLKFIYTLYGGRCVTVRIPGRRSGGEIIPNTQLAITDCSVGKTNQRWSGYASDSANYTIIRTQASFNTNKFCIGVGAGGGDGAPVQAKSCPTSGTAVPAWSQWGRDRWGRLRPRSNPDLCLTWGGSWGDTSNLLYVAPCGCKAEPRQTFCACFFGSGDWSCAKCNSDKPDWWLWWL